MPRGLSSTITDELDSVVGDLPLYAVRITRKADVLFWAQAGDGTGSGDNSLVIDGDNYTARLISISGLEFNPNEAGPISVVVANVDGIVTTLERSESFLGCKLEIIEYLPTIDEFSIRWSGYCDNIGELTQDSATIPAYPASSTSQVVIPKRLVALPCGWKFADGVHCKYQDSPTIGFVTAVVDGAVDNSSDPVSIRVTALADGRAFKNGHEIFIGTERLLVTDADVISGGKQFIECARAQRGTAIASHSIGAAVSFANCFFSVDDCKTHGMYGNNSSDQTGAGDNRNYFGGFPFVTGYQTGRYVSVKGGKASPLRLDFSGNESAYGTPLGLPFGKCRINDAALLLAKPEDDFLSTLWAVCSGILATNGTDDDQSAPLGAYFGGPGSPNIYVNGVSRHDPRPGYGIEGYNGVMDAPPPSAAFFPAGVGQIDDFIDNRLGFWGTARIVLRINTKDHPSIDLTGQTISGAFEVKWGVLVRVYSDPVTYDTKYCMNNPAWVLMHLMADNVTGEGLDYGRFNIQSFIDFADYCDELVDDTINFGDTVPRWTFNGHINQRKSAQDWRHLISLGAYALPPFLDKDGLLKIKALKSETLSGIPVFSSKVASSARNILWDGNRSSLRKFRRPLPELPNELRVSFIDKDTYAKVTINVVSRETQSEFGEKIGDDSLRVLTKSIDLPGTSTIDEAARIGTLILRAGEFGQGGLSNNCKVIFRTFYRDSADLEIGDPIEVQDDLLDAVDERYFRITRISDQSSLVGNDSRFYFVREVEAVLHDNDIYDDTAFSVTDFTHIDTSSANDKQPPPVMDFAIVEAGALDGNNKPVSRLTITYTEPDPKDNYRSVVIFMSSDDSGDPVGDWRILGELHASDGVLEAPISTPPDTIHFAAVSRSLSGHTGDVEALDDAGDFVYPRLALLVDGMLDTTLPAPTGLQIFIGSNLVTLKWNPYTGADLAFFKNYHVYRGTTNVLGSATLIGTVDYTGFIDNSGVPGTLYYYWVRGVDVLLVEGTATSSVNTTSPADSGVDTTVPDAPTIGVVANLGSYNVSRYDWTVGVDKPGGAANWANITQAQIQIASDSGFSSVLFDRTYSARPPLTENYGTNTPGTYYFRARVTNAFGNSAWSSTLTRKTNLLDNLTADTTIPPAPDNLVIRKTSDNPQLAGNEFEVAWDIPTSNCASMWGWTVYLHDSSTLPTATTVETGTQGVLVPGVSELTDSSKAWTINAYANKDVVIFSDKRGGSPTYDYEGAIYLNKIVSNTATKLVFDCPAERQTRDLTGLKYYIVTPGGNNHFHEKLKYSTDAQLDQGILGLTDARASAHRTAKFASGLATLYVWVALYNAYGEGKVTASPPSATFAGVTSGEIKDSAVITTKLLGTAAGNGAVTAVKTNVVNLGDITLQLGTVQTGKLQTAASGTRVEIDGTNGLRAYSGSTLRTQVSVGGGNPADIQATYVMGIVDQLGLYSNNGSNYILISSSGITMISPGGTIALGNNIGVTGNVTASGVFNGDGSGLTALSASNLSSGTVNNARLSASVVLYGGSSIAGNINVNSGYGIASGGTSFACASDAEIYQSSTKVAAFNTSGTHINIGGVYYNLSVDGSGFVKAS